MAHKGLFDPKLNFFLNMFTIYSHMCKQLLSIVLSTFTTRVDTVSKRRNFNSI